MPLCHGSERMKFSTSSSDQIYSVLHLVPHHVPGYSRQPVFQSPPPPEKKKEFGDRLVGSNLFCYFARIVVVFIMIFLFLGPSSPIFNRHYLFILSFVFYYYYFFFGESDNVYSFVLRHLEHPAYIYIFKIPHQARQNL